MPVTPTYPGVYIQEIPSGVKTIVGVATSITAFVGSATRGPTNEPVRIANFGDFVRKFGDIEYTHMLGYSVSQFFLNGGTDATIVRVANQDTATKSQIDVGGLLLEASGEGRWGNQLRVRVDKQTRDFDPANPDKEFFDPADPDPASRKGKRDPNLFNLTIFDRATGGVEEFKNLSVDPEDPRFADTVLGEESVFVDVIEVPEEPPEENDELDPPTADPFDDENDGYYYAVSTEGVDGDAITNADIVGDRAAKSGVFALEQADLFNILVLPPPSRNSVISPDTYAKAAEYCVERRAFMIADPGEGVDTIEDGEKYLSDLLSLVGVNNGKNVGAFFPRIKMGDVRKENRTKSFAPSGAIAGVFAKTDLQRGVWKSPAGIEASLVGVREFETKMTDPENGRLNILGMNCLRNFPSSGNVVWGSRTLVGGDRLSSEWKYLAVRRFALFLEESLYRGTQWVVFEPNDEPLWSQIRLNIGAFMQSLFRQGAFQGASPREAYFVRCGSDTTTQDDINKGIVNIEVGFAPLKPAEFVIIKFQQMSGKIDT